MVGAWQQEVRHGAGAVSWVLRFNPQLRLRKTANWRWHGHWTPVPCFQEDCPSESFPNSSSNWGVSVQKYEPLGPFSFKPQHYMHVSLYELLRYLSQNFSKDISSFLVGTAIDFILMSLSDTGVKNQVEKCCFVIRFQK